MSLLSAVSGQSWPSVTGTGGVDGNRFPREGGVTLSFCSSVAGPSRGGQRDSFGFLGTQGSPSWSPRFGRRPLVLSAGEILTCCFLSNPRMCGVGRGTYYSLMCLSVRLFIPAPSHPSWFSGVCTGTNGFFSFLTRAGKLTSRIRPSISNETVRRDIHHRRAQGWGVSLNHPPAPPQLPKGGCP